MPICSTFQKTMIVFDHLSNNTINNSIQKGSSLYNSKLKDYISSNAVQNFLKSYQYPNTFELCIQELKKRLNTKNFPHEIGVFLGYPLDDVIGFIEHKPYYLVGDWKVYQNVNEAKKQFDLFKQTKEKMLNQIHNGYELCEIL